MQFQSFTQQIKYNSQEIKILKEAESQQITQQALHPRRQSAVERRIPPTPFVERESTSANVFSKTTRRDETLV